MSICEFQPVCATMRRTTQPYKKGGGFGATNTYAALYPTRKGGCMSGLLKRTTPCARLQYNSVHFGQFYDIIERQETPSYKTTPQGACNTEQGLTIDYEGGSANG